MLFRKREQTKRGPTHESHQNNEDDGDTYVMLQVIKTTTRGNTVQLMDEL